MKDTENIIEVIKQNQEKLRRQIEKLDNSYPAKDLEEIKSNQEKISGLIEAIKNERAEVEK